ncbi:MAG: hypothetical protein ACLTSZ_10765 [Lachnospiraceae bacterium]
MESLLRTQVGPFIWKRVYVLARSKQLRDAGRLSEVIQPIDSVFQSYRAWHLTKAGDRLVQNGNPVEAVPELIADATGKMDESDGERYRIYSSSGAFGLCKEWRRGRTLLAGENVFGQEIVDEIF